MHKIWLLVFALFFQISLLNCGVVFSSDNIIALNKAYGLIKRINTSSGIAVIITMSGIFYVDDKIVVYDKQGDEICIGQIKSVYTDEIFVEIEDGYIDSLIKGLLITKNFSSSDVIGLDDNKYNDGLAILDSQDKEADLVWDSYYNQQKGAAKSAGATKSAKPKSQQVTGTIEAIGWASSTFTVRGKKGDVELKAGEKVNLRDFSVGDKVVVKYANGIASSVKEVKVKMSGR